MEFEIDIREINAMINIFGTVVATPNVSEETKDKCNKQIARLVNMLDPVVDQLHKDCSPLSKLSL